MSIAFLGESISGQSSQGTSYLHVGDVVSLFTEEGDISGFFGTLGLVDDRCVIQPCPDGLEQPPKTFRDCLFRTCAINRYASQKELWKAEKVLNAQESGSSPSAPDSVMLRRLQTAADKEREQNLIEQKNRVGESLKYGQSVQLLHCKSEKFVTVNRTEAARVERTAFRVTLDSLGNEGSWFYVEPFYKLRSRGDYIVVGDKVTLVPVSATSRVATQVRHQLHVSATYIPDMPGYHEINCINETTCWKINLCLDYTECKAGFLKSGDVVRLFHAEQEMFLTLDEYKSKPTVYLRKTHRREAREALNPKALWEVELQCCPSKRIRNTGVDALVCSVKRYHRFVKARPESYGQARQLLPSLCFDPFRPDEPDEWQLFDMQLEQWLIANEVTDEKIKKGTLLSAPSQKTLKLTVSLLLPKTVKTATYEEIQNVLYKYFEPEKNELVERFRFKSCKRQEGQSIAYFMQELRRQASTCKFDVAKPNGYLDDALRDQFVSGVQNDAIQRRLLTEKNLTLEKAVELAQAIEAATEHSREMSHSSAETNKVYSTQKDKPPPDYKCFRCTKVGDHYDAKCFFVNQKCFKCGKIGHISKACDSTQKMSKTTSNHLVCGDSVEPHVQNVDTESSKQEPPFNPSLPFSYSDIFNITSQNQTVELNPKYTLPVHVNGIKHAMAFDTGSAPTIVNANTWNAFGRPPLQKSDTQLVAYGGTTVPCLGKTTVHASVGRTTAMKTLYVVERGASLFGRDWINTFMSELSLASVAGLNGAEKCENSRGRGNQRVWYNSKYRKKELSSPNISPR